MDFLALVKENVICGKVDQASKYPPAKRGQPGVVELVGDALKNGVSASDILHQGLMAGMEVVGQRFKSNEIFVPDVLMSAKAMKGGLQQLKPFFAQGNLASEGAIIIGTVQGDIHDIGKNLVAMMFEGAGFQVIDLGMDVAPTKFLEAAKEHPKAVVGLSALLTTTMMNMKQTIDLLRTSGLSNPVIIGGAPVTQAFADEIKANLYAPDPQSAVENVRSLLSKG